MNDDFKALEAAFYDAMRRGDVAAMDRMMDEDCVYVHSLGNRDSKASYLAKVRDGFYVYHTVEVTQDTILRRGDVAVVVGTMTGRITAGGAERTLNNIRTSVWTKTEAGWRLLAFQPTPLRDS